jgi:peptidoglycan/xylan/chitin deacetylase (PgdA/CDA1 family)
MSAGMAAKAATWLPLGWVRPLSGVSLVVPFYHLVSDSYVPHVSPLYPFRSIAEFEADLECFLRGSRPVSLNDIVDALDGKRALPRSCFHVTFDDGFREVAEIVAPILLRAGVPASFYLTTAFLDGGGMAHHNVLSVLLDRLQAEEARGKKLSDRVEKLLPAAHDGAKAVRDRMLSIRYVERDRVQALVDAVEVDLGQYVRDVRPHLTSDEVAKLIGQGFAIGAHSHDHPLYSDLSLEEQIAQTRRSLGILDAKFGFRPRAFAFPHNDDHVSDAFFGAVAADPGLDISFGTSGLVAHRNPRNIQRVAIEKGLPAERILARQFTRAAIHRLRRPEHKTAL